MHIFVTILKYTFFQSAGWISSEEKVCVPLLQWNSTYAHNTAAHVSADIYTIIKKINFGLLQRSLSPLSHATSSYVIITFPLLRMGGDAQWGADEHGGLLRMGWMCIGRMAYGGILFPQCGFIFASTVYMVNTVDCWTNFLIQKHFPCQSLGEDNEPIGEP